MGSWFSYGDLKIGQGRENAKIYLKENPKELKKVISKVKAFMGLDDQGDAPASKD